HVLEGEVVPIETEPDSHSCSCWNSGHDRCCCWLLTLIDDKGVIDRNVACRINNCSLNKRCLHVICLIASTTKLIRCCQSLCCQRVGRHSERAVDHLLLLLLWLHLLVFVVHTCRM